MHHGGHRAIAISGSRHYNWLVRLVLAAVLLAAGWLPAHAGKLDLDIYARPAEVPASSTPDPQRHKLLPGDPRALRGQSPWVRTATHVGYAGLGLAGLVGSIASGGVAPAVGFGLVALIHGYGLWKERPGARRRR